jgi:hypothetical protein
MPYCRKCGTKIDEMAKFCHVCGTQVVVVAAATPRPAPRPIRRTAFPLVAIVLIAVLVFAVVTSAVILLPLMPVNSNQSNEASAANVNTLNMTLDADVANVNVFFRNLPGNQRAVVNVSANGWRGILGTDQPLALASEEETQNSTLMYAVKVSRAEGWPVLNMLDVVCDIYVDGAAVLNLNVQTDTGTITMNTEKQEPMIFQTLNLKTTTGSIEVVTDSIFTRNISAAAQTGSVHFTWNNALASGNISIKLASTTGSVTANITQTQPQAPVNISLDATTTTGSVNLRMRISDDVGAEILSETNFGGITADVQGFSGNESPLRSTNYPAGSNFLVNLRATTGGIQIDADYESGVRS